MYMSNNTALTLLREIGSGKQKPVSPVSQNVYSPAATRLRMVNGRFPVFQSKAPPITYNIGFANIILLLAPAN